jgi:hypothetical protein
METFPPMTATLIGDGVVLETGDAVTAGPSCGRFLRICGADRALVAGGYHVAWFV